MSLPFNFLALPAEVRLAIYHQYFTLPDGYALGPNLRQLTNSAGEPIQLHLMYTCKLVAQETRSLPHILNAINFSTIHSDYLNLAAKLRAEFCGKMSSRLHWHLLRLCGLINPDISKKVVDKFPFFKQRLEYLKRLDQGDGDPFPDRLAPILPSHQSSPHHIDPHAAAYTLQLIIASYDSGVIDQTKPVILNEMESIFKLSCAHLAEAARVRLELHDWSIPTHQQVADMIKV